MATMSSSQAKQTAKGNWFANAGKSIAQATVYSFKQMTPNINETGTGLYRGGKKVVSSLRPANLVRVTRDISRNKYVKKAGQALKQARTDIIAGNLYNEDRANDAIMNSMGWGDTGSFEDFGDFEDYSYGEDDAQRDSATTFALTTAMAQNAQTTVSVGEAIITNQIGLSTSMLSELQAGFGEVSKQLTTMNNTMSAILDFHNQNTTRFYQEALQSLGRIAPAIQEASYNSQTGAEDVFNSSGGLNMSQYKSYIKQNIKKSWENSALGSMSSMISDDFIEMILADPVGAVTSQFVSAMIPKVMSTSLKSLDKVFGEFTQNMLTEMGTWDNDSNVFKKYLGQIFGVKPSKVDRSTYMKEVDKNVATFDNITRNTIVEVLPKYARESTAYLKEIAMHITKKSSEDMLSGSDVFDAKKNRYVKQKDLKQNFMEELSNMITGSFATSDFGAALKNIENTLNGRDKDAFNAAYQNLVTKLATTDKNLVVKDYNTKNKDAGINELLRGIGGKNEVNLIKQAIQYMYDKEIALGNVVSAQRGARETWNRQIKDFSENYDAYNLHALGISNDTDLADMFTRWQQGEGAKKRKGAFRKDAKGKYKNLAGDKKTIAELASEGIEDWKAGEDAFQATSGGGEIAAKIFGPEFGKAFQQVTGHMKGAMFSVMKGDSLGALKHFGSIFTDSMKRMWDGAKEHFITPLITKLFGKDENGNAIGLFANIQNKLSDSYKHVLQKINGKEYTDSQGKVHALEEGELSLVDRVAEIFGSMKQKVGAFMFGEDTVDEKGNPVHKDGLFTMAKNTFAEGIKGWKEAIFGENEEDAKNAIDDVKKKMINAAPKTVGGAAIGALIGSLTTGSPLGGLIGGWFGGAVMGAAGGLLSQSEKFNEYLFGTTVTDPDGSTRKMGGLISDKTQKFLAKNKGSIITGAALGAVKGIFFPSSMGLFGNIVGGPFLGAALGAGFGMIKNSEAFQEFLFGKGVDGEKKGIVTTMKEFWKGNFSKDDKNKDSKESARALGMGMIGAGGGLLSSAVIGKVGLLGAMVTPMGPLGGAIAGAAVGIAAGSKKFQRFLFGEKDPETGDRKGGLINKAFNFAHTEIFAPLKTKMKHYLEDIKITLKYDILEVVRLPFVSIANHLSDYFNKAKEIISEKVAAVITKVVDFVKPIGKAIWNMLSPVRAILGKAADIVYNFSKFVVTAPFRLITGIGRWITSPIRKAFSKITEAVTWTFTNLGKAIWQKVKKPFEWLGNGISSVIGGVKNFFTGIGDKIETGRQGGGLKGIMYGALAGLTNSEWRRGDANRLADKNEAVRAEKARYRNDKIMDDNRRQMSKILGYDVKYFTEENMQEAMRVAQQKNIKVKWRTGKGGDLNFEDDPATLRRKEMLKAQAVDIEAARATGDVDVLAYAEAREQTQQLKKLNEQLKDLINGREEDDGINDEDRELAKNQMIHDAEEAGFRFDEATQQLVGGPEPSQEPEELSGRERAFNFTRNIRNKIDSITGKIGSFFGGGIQDTSNMTPEEIAALQAQGYSVGGEGLLPGAFNRLKNFFGGHGRAYANGGDVRGGQTVLVGDGGKDPNAAEIFVPKTDGKILSQKGGGIKVVIAGATNEGKKALGLQSATNVADDAKKNLLSFNSLRQKADEVKEQNADNEREEKTNSILEQIRDKEEEHYSVWDTIFSKKGLITMGVLALGAWLFKKISNFSWDKITDFAHKIDTAIEWIKTTFDPVIKAFTRVKEVIENTIEKFKFLENLQGLTDGLSIFGSIKEVLGDIAGMVRKLVGGDVPGAVEDFILDEGEWDANSGARAIYLARNAVKLNNGPVGRTIRLAGSGVYNLGKNIVGANNNLLRRMYLGGKDTEFIKQVYMNPKSTPELRMQAKKMLEKRAKKEATKTAKNAATDVATDVVEDVVGDVAGDVTKDMTSDVVADTTLRSVSDITQDAEEEFLRKNFGDVTSFKPIDAEEEFLRKNFGDVVGDTAIKNADEVAEAAGKTTLTTTKEAAEAAAKNGMTKSFDDIVDVGASVALKNGDEALEAASKDKGLMGKVIGMFTDFLKNLVKAIGQKFPNVADNILAKSLKGLAKTVTGAITKFWNKIVNGITFIFGSKVGGAVASAGLSTAVFVTCGAINGASGAARLFQVDEKAVDGLMIAISTAMGVFTAGTTLGGLLDLISGLVAEVAHIDVLNVIATCIYSVVAGEEAATALATAQTENMKGFESYRTEAVAKEMEAQKKLGIIGENVTTEEFMQGLQDGTYKANLQSYQDWNADQHQTIGYKMGKGITDMAKGAKKLWSGQKAFVDKDGKTYVDKGLYYEILDKDGNPILGEDGQPLQVGKNAVDTSQMQATSIGGFKNTKVGKFLGKHGAATAIVTASIVNPGLGMLVAGGVALKYLFTAKKEEVYAKSDGSYYDAEGNYYNAAGDNLGDKQKITKEEVEALVVSGELIPTEKVVDERPGWKRILQEGWKGIKAGWAKACEIGSAIATGFKKGLDAVSNAVAKFAQGTQRLVGHDEVVWVEPSGAYWRHSGIGWEKCNPSGDTTGEVIDEQAMLVKVESGLVTQDTKHIAGTLTEPIKQWMSDRWEGLKKGWNDLTTGVKNLVDKAVTKGKQLADKAENFIAKGILGLARLGDHKERVWVEPSGVYWKLNGNQWEKYTASGDATGEMVTSEEMAAMRDQGLVTADDREITGTLSGPIKEGISKVFGGIKDTWNKLSTAAGELFEKLGNFKHPFLDAIKEKGFRAAIKDLFKKDKTMGWYLIDGSGYYIEETKGKYSFYTMNGDRDKERDIDEEKMADLQDAGMVKYEEVLKDSEAKKAMTKIKDAVKDAWKKASDVVSKNWKKFVKWLGGDANENAVDTITGAGGSGSASFSGAGGYGSGGFGGRGPDNVNGFAYYSQNDSAWRGRKYISDNANDNATMGDSGCGPTAMAMIASQANNGGFGKTGPSRDPSPIQMASMASSAGYRDSTGTNEKFIGYASNSMGLYHDQMINPDANYIYSNAAAGRPMILNGIGSGAYTKGGHYVVAVGTDRHGNVLVNDPRGKSYSKPYSPAALARGSRKAWTYGGNGLRNPRKYPLRFGGGEGSENEFANSTINRKQWIECCRIGNRAAAEEIMARGLSYLAHTPEGVMTIQIGGRDYTFRRDCNGLVELFLEIWAGDGNKGYDAYNVIDNQPKHIANIQALGFTRWDGLTWNDLQEGDILVRRSSDRHAEVYATKYNGCHYVYNGGGTCALLNPYASAAGLMNFEWVWRLGTIAHPLPFDYVIGVVPDDGKRTLKVIKDFSQGNALVTENFGNRVGEAVVSGDESYSYSGGDLTLASSSGDGIFSNLVNGIRGSKIGGVLGKIAAVGGVFTSFVGKAINGLFTGNWDNNFDTNVSSFFTENGGANYSSGGTYNSDGTYTPGGSYPAAGNKYLRPIWNYLGSELGFTKEGRAGMMGCWQSESSNDPDTIEARKIRLIDVINDQPALDAYATGYLFPTYDAQKTSYNRDAYDSKVNGYYPGLGLAQWTGPRGYLFYNYAKEHNPNNPADLNMQLDFAKSELVGGCKDSVGKAFKTIRDVTEAATIGVRQYEVYNGSPDARINNAHWIYDMFKDKDQWDEDPPGLVVSSGGTYNGEYNLEEYGVTEGDGTSTPYGSVTLSNGKTIRKPDRWDTYTDEEKANITTGYRDDFTKFILDPPGLISGDDFKKYKDLTACLDDKHNENPPIGYDNIKDTCGNVKANWSLRRTLEEHGYSVDPNSGRVWLDPDTEISEKTSKSSSTKSSTSPSTSGVIQDKNPDRSDPWTTVLDKPPANASNNPKKPKTGMYANCDEIMWNSAKGLYYFDANGNCLGVKPGTTVAKTILKKQAKDEEEKTRKINEEKYKKAIETILYSRPSNASDNPKKPKTGAFASYEDLMWKHAQENYYFDASGNCLGIKPTSEIAERMLKRQKKEAEEKKKQEERENAKKKKAVEKKRDAYQRDRSLGIATDDFGAYGDFGGRGDGPTFTSLTRSSTPSISLHRSTFPISRSTPISGRIGGRGVMRPSSRLITSSRPMISSRSSTVTIGGYGVDRPSNISKTDNIRVSNNYAGYLDTGNVEGLIGEMIGLLQNIAGNTGVLSNIDRGITAIGKNGGNTILVNNSKGGNNVNVTQELAKSGVSRNGQLARQIARG